MRRFLVAILGAHLILAGCQDAKSDRDPSIRSTPDPGQGSSPTETHAETRAPASIQALPGAWQARSIRRFHSAEGSKRVQGMKLGGDEATEPAVNRLEESVVQQNVREAFELSRWVFFPDGTFEARAYKGHIPSARLIGTYHQGELAGEGRSQDNRPVPDAQHVSAKIQQEGDDSLVLVISFDCTFGDASFGAARMAGGGWGTTWSFHLKSRFELTLERGVHKPNQGNALVLASYPIPLEDPRSAVRAPSTGDPLMDQAQRTIEGADYLIANGKAKQAFDQGFWEFYPDGTFRYTHDPARFFPMHELEGRWENQGEGTIEYSGSVSYGEGVLATTVSIEGELLHVDHDGARARLTFRSRDESARYEYTFQQRYRVDQRMAK